MDDNQNGKKKSAFKREENNNKHNPFAFTLQNHYKPFGFQSVCSSSLLPKPNFFLEVQPGLYGFSSQLYMGKMNEGIQVSTCQVGFRGYEWMNSVWCERNSTGQPDFYPPTGTFGTHWNIGCKAEPDYPKSMLDLGNTLLAEREQIPEARFPKRGGKKVCRNLFFCFLSTKGARFVLSASKLCGDVVIGGRSSPAHSSWPSLNCLWHFPVRPHLNPRSLRRELSGSPDFFPVPQSDSGLAAF